MQPTTPHTRRASLAALLALGGLLAGCSGVRSISSEVQTFGEWPVGRAPGTYAFDRLPSSQAPSPKATDAEKLENVAALALKKAGFQAAAEGQQPDLLVQVGARSQASERNPWDEPLWWRGGVGYWRVSPWHGAGWGVGMRFDSPRYDRSVGLLLRDRATGKPLYEAQASSTGNSVASPALLGAMLEAALSDFPKANPAVHTVSVVVTE